MGGNDSEVAMTPGKLTERFHVGDEVRVKGYRQKAVILRCYSDYRIKGGVVLDRAIDGFRLWNQDELVHWRKR